MSPGTHDVFHYRAALSRSYHTGTRTSKERILIVREDSTESSGGGPGSAMVAARGLEKAYLTGGATVRALRGVVLIAGESISGMSDRGRTRFRAQRMGFVFQTYNLIPVLSGVENVELPLLVAGAKPKDARCRALDALEMVGVPEQANKRPN